MTTFSSFFFFLKFKTNLILRVHYKVNKTYEKLKKEGELHDQNEDQTFKEYFNPCSYFGDYGWLIFLFRVLCAKADKDLEL